MQHPRFLMCPPDYYQIDWSINPYMDLAHRVDEAKAQQQFDELVRVHRSLGHEIEFIPPVPGLADLIFIANGALVIADKVMLGHPRYSERAPEIPHIRRALEALGFTEIADCPHDFSGQGDALPVGDKLIFMGNSWRTSPDTAGVLADYFERDVISLATIRDTTLPPNVPANSRFYDIDIAISVLGPDTIAYAPEAFELESRRRLETAIATHKLTAYPVPIEEALRGALNLVSDGAGVMRPAVEAPTLAKAVANAGLSDHTVEISELWKGGGGVRCTTLTL